MSSDNMNGKLQFLVYTLAMVAFISIIYSIMSNLFSVETVTPTVSAQTDPFLDRRINQIEQRFYTIESRINRLEQESRLPSTIPRTENGNNDIEIRLLRSQIEVLQSRVSELECALLKLDERTLTEAARRGRSQSAKDTIDPCRKTANSPVVLSNRP